MNTISPRSETEALLLEKFQALLTELDTVGDNASYGHVPDTAFDSWGHDFLFTAIRQLAAETLEKKIQDRINAAELLKEVGCFTLSHVTIGSKATEIADEIDTKLQNNSEIRKVFQEAKGDTEFATDGAFVNIRMKTRPIAGWSAKSRVLRSGSEARVRCLTSGTAVNCRIRP